MAGVGVNFWVNVNFHLNKWQPNYKKEHDGAKQTTNNNHERVKKKSGRPKGTAIFTEEENKERARQRARLYYSLNIEKERERKRLEYHAKESLV